VTAECKRLAEQVREPAMRGGDDAKAVIARYRAALLLANERIGAQGACVEELAARYAGYTAGAPAAP
jgi:hypothetical protein